MRFPLDIFVSNVYPFNGHLHCTFILACTEVKSSFLRNEGIYNNCHDLEGKLQTAIPPPYHI
jgi:hypothetical protein